MQSKKSVMIIEDDNDIRILLKQILENEGYAVSDACNGREALDLLRVSDPLPSLILLDLTMPVMDGYEFRREQNNDQKLAAIPVVVMTADGHVDVKAAKVGAVNALKKPFDLEVVVKTTRNHCDES